MDNDPDVLFQHGERLDDSRSFMEAYQAFALAADGYKFIGNRDMLYLSLMRAGTAVAKAEGWRTQAALWERLGSEIGLELEEGFPHRAPMNPGQNSMYYVVSHEEWGRQVSTDERRRWLGHRRALAYKWAAYNIDNDRELVLEARLFRMAGAAWEKVEVQPSEFHGTRDDEIRQALEMPNKWREAIRCYFRAAATALRSSDWESYDRVHESWREEELQWGERINPNLPSPMDLDAGSDLQRIRRCWETYRHEIFADRYVNFPQVIADTYEEEARQLAELQRLYASRGDRKHARVMEHQRMQLHRRSARERRAWTTWLTRTLYQYLTKSGTSVRRTVASVAVLNLLVFPIAYLVADAISKSGSGRIGWPDAMIYSFSTMLSFAAPQYAATGAAVPIIQDIQALLGYISLGYILWLVLRSYQE